jgi:hypothetical protein
MVGLLIFVAGKTSLLISAGYHMVSLILLVDVVGLVDQCSLQRGRPICRVSTGCVSLECHR